MIRAVDGWILSSSKALGSTTLSNLFSSLTTHIKKKKQLTFKQIFIYFRLFLSSFDLTVETTEKSLVLPSLCPCLRYLEMGKVLLSLPFPRPQSQLFQPLLMCQRAPVQAHTCLCTGQEEHRSCGPWTGFSSVDWDEGHHGLDMKPNPTTSTGHCS